MKSRFQQLRSRIAGQLAHAALVPVVALMASPVWAALPQITNPDAIGGGAVAQGDWMGAFGGWFKKGIAILAIVLAALAFVYVMMGALTRWKTYTSGKIDMAELVEYFMVAGVFIVFIVLMATYSASTLA